MKPLTVKQQQHQGLHVFMLLRYEQEAAELDCGARLSAGALWVTEMLLHALSRSQTQHIGRCRNGSRLICVVKKPLCYIRF